MKTKRSIGFDIWIPQAVRVTGTLLCTGVSTMVPLALLTISYSNLVVLSTGTSVVVVVGDTVGKVVFLYLLYK
jgi:hypothetical protein